MPVLNNNPLNAAITNSTNNVIGKSINFPVTFANSATKNKLLVTVEGSDVIGQSIYIILSTRQGSRYNNPFFGSRLAYLIFSQNDLVTQDLLYYYTVDALQKWEKRITITNVAFEFDPTNDHYIGIKIFYVINSTNVPGVYVYPYSLEAEPMSSLLAKKQIYK